MVNAKRKGNSFERSIANFLTSIMGFKYHRTPLSGGFATSFNTQAVQFKGDVFTEEILYDEIVIECKSYKELTFVDFFNTKSKLYNWIEQSREESKGKPWILFFKINSRGTYILYSKNFMTHSSYITLIKKIIEYRRYSGSVRLRGNALHIIPIKIPKVEKSQNTKIEK